MDCSICCNKFNNSRHSKVFCNGCEDDSVACKTCCQTFILNSNTDPSCMFCNTKWDRQFMNENLTKTFVNKDLKIFTEKLFLERQISLLPETQKDAILEKRCIELDNQIILVKKEKSRLKKLMNEQADILNAHYLERARLRYGTSTQDTSKENFTVKCPTNDCKGFLDSKHFCDICETQYCKMCMEIKQEGHVCNEDTKATIQAIKKDAKPCPGCGEMISKIDGCDQMWCVKCHVQFSWKTGATMNGFNHNPEYFRWMRDSGQTIQRTVDPLDARNRQFLCGRELDARIIRNIIVNLFPHGGTPMRLLEIYRFYRHIQGVHFGVRDSEHSLKQLRIKYLLNITTKEFWQKEIQKIDKQDNKEKAYENIWRLLETVLENIMERVLEYDRDQVGQEKYIKLAEEGENFRKYINSCFIKVSDTYSSSTSPGVNENWREHSNLKKYNKTKN